MEKTNHNTNKTISGSCCSCINAAKQNTLEMRYSFSGRVQTMALLKAWG